MAKLTNENSGAIAHELKPGHFIASNSAATGNIRRNPVTIEARQTSAIRMVAMLASLHAKAQCENRRQCCNFPVPASGSATNCCLKT